MSRPPCRFCGEPNRDPGGSGYCLACRGTDWFRVTRQQGSNDGQSDTSLADGPSTLPEPTIGAEKNPATGLGT